jgi:hypothetical protein
MASVKLVDLVPDVVIEIQGAPSFTIIHSLRRAATELCERTLIWEQSEEVLDAVAGEVEQDLPIPRNGELVQLISISRKGVELTPVTVRKIYQQQGDPTDETRWATPSSYSTDGIKTTRMAPIPKVDEELECRMALKPNQDATTVPYELGVRWRTALETGAKHFLCMMANTEWYDPNRAVYYRQLFDRELARAKVAQIQGYDSTNLRVKSVRFGA